MNCLALRIRFVLASFLFVFAVMPSAPAHAVDLETYDSERYTIHTNLPVEAVRPLARHMDMLHVEYTRRFRDLVGRVSDRQKQNLYLFASRDDYISQMAEFNISAENSGGMFFVSGDNNGLATWVEERSNRSVIQVLQHEGFHQFANKYIGTNLPVWVNEGLAVYFEQAIMVEGRLRLGIAEPHRIDSIQGAVEDGDAIPILDLITMTSQQWHANMGVSQLANLQYTQSWSICYFLIHGKDGRYQRAFNRYLELVASGRSSERAFEQAFGTDDYSALERQWQEFVAEELEPDNFSVMLTNMEFLAYGVVYTKAMGEDMPVDLAGLKTLLQAVGFQVRSIESGAVIAADDESVYHYKDRRDREHDFGYTLESESGLPEITASASRPRVHIEWVTVDGRLSYEVKFD